MRHDPTVFVVDDDPQLRRSLVELLEAASLKSESFASAEEFLNRYEPNRAGCLVLDVRMCGMSGLHLQEELKRLGYRIPIIMISGMAAIPDAVRAVKAGALDYLEKPIHEETLLNRIYQVLDQDERGRRDEARLAGLTDRERQIMDLLVGGLSAKQIALELGISHKTVNIHRANILEKSTVENVAELIQLHHRLQLPVT